MVEDEAAVPNGKFGMLYLNSLHNTSCQLEEKIILGTCATILIHYLKENRYFGTKISSSIIA